MGLQRIFMISKLFKKPTIVDLLKELKSANFREKKVNSILQDIDINHTDQNFQNFLHLIISENKIESVKYLLRNNINFNAQDSKGSTPLMLACKYGYADAVEELLKINADVNIEDYSGYTAIEYAISSLNFHIYRRIKTFISDINRKNRKNYTYLHVAIKSQSLDIVEDLLSDRNFEIPEDILFFKYSFKNQTILNAILSKFDNFDKKDEMNRNILFYIVESGIENK